jgi:hypothetical protein
MRTMLVAVAVGLAGLLGPAAAGASVVDTYQRLAERGISPAPLVPTTVPRSLAPMDRTIDVIGTRRGYAIRFQAFGPDAVAVVSGGEYRSLRAALRDHKRQGFTRRRMRIRGKRGYALTRRLGPTTRSLVWVERGVVYAVGSGTPRSVSLAGLRGLAAGLDRLERDYIGGHADPDNSSEAFALTTARTVSIDVSFEAQCTSPGSAEPSIRVGRAGVTLLRRQGGRFSFDVARSNRGSGTWSGTISGTISPTAMTVDVRATGTFDGLSCDTGALTLVLDRRAS